MNKLIGLALAVLLLSTGGVRAQEVVSLTSAAGTPALLAENHVLPIVNVNFLFRRAGSAYDPETKEGLAEMMSYMLQEGSGAYDSEAFETMLQRHAIRLGVRADADNLTLSIQTLTEHLDTALSLAATMLTSPRFDDASIVRVQKQIYAMQRQMEQQPQNIAGQAWDKLALGNHPYSQPALGTKTAVATITREDLQAYMRQHIAADTLVISVAGDVKKSEFAALLDKHFSTLMPKAETSARTIDDITMAGGKFKHVEKPLPQTVIVFGQEGVKRSDPDFFAAYTLNYILGGGGFASILTEELREKRGLVYGVSTGLMNFEHTSLIAGTAATRPEKVDEAVQLIRNVFAQVREQGVTAEQLDDAKRNITGSYPLNLDTNSKVVSYMQAIHIHGLPLDYIRERNTYFEAVTLEQVNRLAKSLIDPAKLTIVTVGTEEKEE